MRPDAAGVNVIKLIFPRHFGDKRTKGYVSQYNGSGGPAVGNTQHRINFAESVWRSAFYLQIWWENSGQNLWKNPSKKNWNFTCISEHP